MICIVKEITAKGIETGFMTIKVKHFVKSNDAFILARMESRGEGN